MSTWQSGFIEASGIRLHSTRTGGEGSIATHGLTGEWGGVIHETLVEATPEGAEHIRSLPQAVHIDLAPLGLYVGDRRGAVVVEADGSWRRATEAEMKDYDLEL